MESGQVISVQVMMKSLRVVFAGGGTGGHLYPAIAIAEAFKRRMREFAGVFIGTARGIEARVIPPLGYRLELVPVRGLLRKLSPGNLVVPFYLVKSVWQCWRLFKKFDPHLIIGTGGYVSGPALLAAWLSRRKFFVQEQNSFPGLVNRWLGERAEVVFLSFEESKKFFRKQEHLRVVGNPVRANLAGGNREAAAQKWSLKAERITLLIFGGSQGARRINELVLEILPRLDSIKNLQVLWATGPQHFDPIAANAASLSKVKIVSYIDDMASAYALADFVLCRAGATTIFELTNCGLPSILVPFPFATADHQTFNARALERAGAARVLIEKELTAEALFKNINELATQAESRKQMAAAAKKLARPQAAAEIVEICLSRVDQLD
jgi:UDP-N-acetylglucosamine--N-acetylmuramyl-(pentapeptide) pyrophosphoryl-undecaprenol N-acetylglucosamine transferase